MVVTAAADDTAVAPHRDPRVERDLLDQIARHGCAQVGAAHEDGHLPCEAGEVHRGLPGRVAAADDDDLSVVHLPGRRHRGAVVDASPDERLDLGNADPAVVDARGDDDGPGADVAALGRHDVRLVALADLQRGDRPPGVEAGAEQQGLAAGALGELHARDAAREAEVVADHRGGAGLPADGLGLHDDRAQALAGPVDRGRQARRAGAHHGQVDDGLDVDIARATVELGGDLPHRGRREDLLLPVGPHQRVAHLGAGGLILLDDLPALGALRGEEPVGRAGPVQVIADAQGQAVAVRRDQADGVDQRHRDRRAPLAEQFGDGDVKLLVTGPARHQQEGVQLALGLHRAQLGAVHVEVLPRRDDDPPAGRHDRAEHEDGRHIGGVVELGVDDEERHQPATADHGHGPRDRLVTRAGADQVVVTAIPPELVEQVVADRGSWNSPSPRSGTRARRSRGRAGPPAARSGSGRRRRRSGSRTGMRWRP